MSALDRQPPFSRFPDLSGDDGIDGNRLLQNHVDGIPLRVHPVKPFVQGISIDEHGHLVDGVGQPGKVNLGSNQHAMGEGTLRFNGQRTVRAPAQLNQHCVVTQSRQKVRPLGIDPFRSIGR